MRLDEVTNDTLHVSAKLYTHRKNFNIFQGV